ncbi:MAG: hypothetical protein J6W64_06770 [Bacilli bacterium]|nr:hypothetical protein [Bacilli bacterium]
MNDIERLEQKVDANKEEILNTISQLHNHEEKINSNADKIQRNTGALELLHTINSGSKKFYNIWLITFTVFLCSVVLNIFLLIKLLCR